MRKYSGKYPHRVHSIFGTFAPGIALIETNDGGKYFIRAKDTNGRMPTLGSEIHDYKFQRAHVQYYRQDVTRFTRVVEDVEQPFFEFVATPLALSATDEVITDLELHCRRDFIKIMAQQNVLVRFK